MNINGIQGNPHGDPTGGARVQAQTAMDAARMKNLSALNDESAAPENRKHAAKELETLFVSLLVKEMRKTLPEGFFAKGPGSDVLSGFFDQMMSEALTSGNGTGLQDQILAGWHVKESSSAEAASEKTLSEKATS